MFFPDSVFCKMIAVFSWEELALKHLVVVPSTVVGEYVWDISLNRVQELVFILLGLLETQPISGNRRSQAVIRLG